MKKFIITLLSIVCAVTVSAQNFRQNCVVAHRGAWKNTGHPQNSLASFRAAAEMGCHGSECDVHLTADDSLVVTHDVTYNGLEIEHAKYADLIKKPLKITKLSAICTLTLKVLNRIGITLCRALYKKR
jgi:glycerophosphoryl diester phosphodiesterase